MREIKFRVWQKSVGEFVNIPQEKREEKCFGVGWLALDLDGTLVYQTKTTYTPVEDPDDFIVQQYTGLTDKNEVEIYEGDILGYPTDTNDKKLKEVRWAKAYSGEQWCEFEIRNYAGKDVKSDESDEPEAFVSYAFDFYGGISQAEYKIVVGNIFEGVDK